MWWFLGRVGRLLFRLYLLSCVDVMVLIKCLVCLVCVGERCVCLVIKVFRFEG